MTRKSQMTLEQIQQRVAFLEKADQDFYKGRPLISDVEYDERYEELLAADPDNPFFHPAVIPPSDVGMLEHSVPILSRYRVYSVRELEHFVTRTNRMAQELGLALSEFRMMPKVDGIQAKDENNLLVTRGNGRRGVDVTYLFREGLLPIGGRNLGLGQVVMRKSHFDQHCTSEFSHPRNVISAVLNADRIPPLAIQALHAKSVHFVPEVKLPSWQGSGSEVLERWSSIAQNLAVKMDYPLDGTIIAVVDPLIREKMETNRNYTRSQMIIKLVE